MIIFQDIISSRNNPTVKFAASLSDRKGREANRSFLAEGAKLSIEALRRALPVTHIFIREDRAGEFLSMLEPFMNEEKFSSTSVILLTEGAFSKISTEKAPQGIISVIKYLDFFRNMDIIYKEDFFISQDEKALSLYSLRDPGNLGAIIRSAVAFGVDHIILSSDSADIYNPKAVRAAMGTMFGIKISYVSDFGRFVELCRSNRREVYAAELSAGAVSIKEVAPRPTDIIVIGNEGHGIPSEVSAKCTASLYIPIAEGAESLNAAVAASLLLWEQMK